MTKTKAIALNRRTILAAAGASTAALAAPRILRAQGKELVVGGAASHKNFVETIIAPVVEKKYGCKIVYEGTRSLVNLEKMQKNKDKQYLSVVQMDDPVMIPAVAEGLLEKITPAKVPNIANLKPGLTEIIVHLGHDDAELQAVTVDHEPYGSAWRQRDYDVVTSPEFAKALKDHNIIVVKWKDLYRAAQMK